MGARICVEVDLLMDPPKEFPLRIGQRLDTWQEVVYEKPILYYNSCFRQGHAAATYRAAMKSMELSNRERGLLKKEKQVERKIWKKVDRRNTNPRMELEPIRDEVVDTVNEVHASG